jgi:hypothetical protein
MLSLCPSQGKVIWYELQIYTWVGIRGNLDVLEKRNISCFCWKLNCSSLVVELRTQCRLLYTASAILSENTVIFR